MNTHSKVLNSVISSRHGLHLTAYIENNRNLQDLRRQIDDCLETAWEMLRPVLSPEELRKFLSPLTRLRRDTRTLLKFKGNIAFFRNEKWSRIVNLPVPVEPICIVADSFHTKPVLRWIQEDQEFLLVYIGSEYANLFWGNLNSFEFVDTLPMHRPIDDEYSFVSRNTITQSRQTFFAHWLNTAITEMGEFVPANIFIGSEHDLPQELLQKIRHDGIKVISSAPPRHCDSKINFYRDVARSKVESALSNKTTEMLAQFAIAQRLQLTSTNLNEIAKLAAENRIESLFIAGDLELFGRYDEDSGSLELNPIQTDHLDDCILDDIAQTATRHSVRVIVVDRDKMPDRCVAAAVIKPAKRLPVETPASDWHERRA